MKPDGTSGNSYPQYRRKQALPGLVNQAWSPVDDWFHVFGAAGGELRFYKLIEDMQGNGPAKADWVSRTNNTSRGINDVYGFDNILAGAQAGYKGVFAKIDGEWVPPVLPCVETCESTGSLSLGTPPTGAVDAAYTHSITASNIDAASISASGLPAGLSIDSTTGAITGTPTIDGQFGVVITGTAPKTSGIGTCTLTRFAYITIDPAPP